MGIAVIPFGAIGAGASTRVRAWNEATAVADPFQPIYERGDRVVAGLVAAHLVVAALLAPVYGTWRITAVIGIGVAALFYGCMIAAPGRFLTRNVAGLVLQTFCALHIFQMRGMAEM